MVEYVVSKRSIPRLLKIDLTMKYIHYSESQYLIFSRRSKYVGLNMTALVLMFFSVESKRVVGLKSIPI